METLYPSYCEKFGWMLDENALSSMKAANAAKLTELDAKIKDAEENLGDVEVRDAMLAKAEFYAGTADRGARWRRSRRASGRPSRSARRWRWCSA